MIFLFAFLVGGMICAIAEIVLVKTKLLPVHVTALFVTIGALLDSFHLYDKLNDISGAGSMVPITSFGHSLSHGALA